jgi:HAD superfamily hydrolase (TIGR01490 family)
MRSVRRKGATPAGGESGGRQTVRLRGGRAGPVHSKAYVYPGQVTNRSRHADNENALSVIGSLAVSSSAEAGRRPAAAFFDLDKTIIAKSSTLAYGPSFYRNGLISRGDAVRGAVAQLLFTRHGASHDRMEQIRAQVSQLCRGWPAERVREIVARHLDELIVPYVYDEARALLDAHRAAGEDVIIVSTSGDEMVSPIGALLGAALVIATRMEIAEGCYTGHIEFYAYGPAKAERVRELARERGYRLADCSAYSDSITDLPMLEAVGHPHAVNPDRALRRLAQLRGWPVLAFSALPPVPARGGPAKGPQPSGGGQ